MWVKEIRVQEGKAKGKTKGRIRNFFFRGTWERPSKLKPEALLPERSPGEDRFPERRGSFHEGSVRPWLRRKPRRKLSGQGVRGPGEALQDLAHGA